MLGAYSAVVVQAAGLPLLFSIPLALAVSAVAGAVAERLVIRHLYRRPFDTFLATGDSRSSSGRPSRRSSAASTGASARFSPAPSISAGSSIRPTGSSSSASSSSSSPL